MYAYPYGTIPSKKDTPKTQSQVLQDRNIITIKTLTPPSPKQPGSGPAYFFAMVEHLIAAATKLGLPADAATRLAAQTCLGAGRMLTDTDPSDSDNPNSSGVDPGQLRRNVTSPHGTTEAALRSFEASGFEAVVERAVRAAAERGEELGRTLGGSTTS